MGKVITKEILNQLTEFVVCELGASVLDGVTYALFLKDNKKDMKRFEIYKVIKNTILNNGFRNDEIFRIYEVSNGYVIDLDLVVAKQITAEMCKAMNVKDNYNLEQQLAEQILSDKLEQRRKRELISLAKYIKSEYDNGKREIQVALFSKNSTDRIIVTGVDNNNEKVMVVHKAYSVRNWDLETLNYQILMKAGIRIRSVTPYEILPRRNGISFQLNVEPYRYKNGLMD